MSKRHAKPAVFDRASTAGERMRAWQKRSRSALISTVRTMATPPAEELMAYGINRFLTTHTGSLPRADDLVRAMFAKEEGVPVDREALAARIRSAVDHVVRKQVEADVDIVNDGEQSKPSYATYIKDRLTGFGGESGTYVYSDLEGFPALARKVFGDPGRS